MMSSGTWCWFEVTRRQATMGKSNKPTKWFKAVKKAFRSPSRSPSKEKPSAQDDTVSLSVQLLLSSRKCWIEQI